MHKQICSSKSTETSKELQLSKFQLAFCRYLPLQLQNLSDVHIYY